MNARWRSMIGASWILVAGALLGLPRAAAAQTATITGRVVAEGSGAPLPDARVMVVGTSIAVLTNTDGHYTIRNAPTGALQIRTLRVGYQEQKKPATVAPGATVTVDFTMAVAIVKLQEVVTTATGVQRKVELGNALSAIDAAKAVEETPITTVADLLTAKAPGVVVSPSTMTGAAPVIRIRGANSLSLANDPIFIVDGIRYRAGTYNPFIGGTGGSNFSFLNSLNPEEIQDVEIVKGPSAATLYGTDAANGVVVVTTKRGRAGAARWNWFAEGGAISDRNTYPATYALWGHAPNSTKPIRCQIATMTATTCLGDSLTSLNMAQAGSLSPIGLGHNATYGMQVSGGTDAIRYFISGDLFNEIGTYRMPDFAKTFLADSQHTPLRDEWVHPEAFQRQSVRANISASPSATFDVSVNAGFTNSNQRAPNTDNNLIGIGGSYYLTSGTASCNLDYACVGTFGEPLHGYARFSPAQVFQQLTTYGIQRFVGSTEAQWRPFTWMQNSGTVGVDLANQTYLNLCRFQECPDAGTTRLGFVESDHDNNRFFTAKAVSTSSWNPNTWANLKTSLGADYVNDESDFSHSGGSTLPPGAQTVAATASKTASDRQPTASKTFGLYVQEQAAIRDRLYLTGAVRSDQNSAFGTNFQRVFYPKASLSWIVSDESFFPRWDFFNSLRLRLAYGQSGVQPGSTDALRTFTARTVNLNGTLTPALEENALGNPNLKPETSAEFEGGFETRLWSNRVNLDVTYYNKQTKDALINLPIAASAAPSALTVRSNLGSIKNAGVEAAINSQLLDNPNFAWNITLNGSHNTNKVVSLGFDASGKPIKTIGTGVIRDSTSFPVNGVFARPYRYSDANNDGVIQVGEVVVDTGVVFFGYSAPRDLLSVQNGIELLNRQLRLNVLLDYKGGFSLLNDSQRFICQQSPKACREDQDASLPLWRQARAVAVNYGTVLNGTRYTTTAGYWENGQFWRLREVSATWQLPNRVTTRGLRAKDANLTFGARNLHVWTKYTGIDPETNSASGNTGTSDFQADFLTQAPKTYFTLRLNLHY